MQKSTSLFRKYLVAVLLAGTVFTSCQKKPDAAHTAAQAYEEAIYKGLEFDMPRVQEPSFPAYEVKITDFGAVSGGVVSNTQAFADAIAQVAQKGGGRIIVPKGIWLTGPIVLKSNINLHTESGALVIFSPDFDDYPLIATSFEGLNTYRSISPIYGKDLENIAITGEGVFDGNGDAWRFVKKSKMTASHWEQLIASGGVLNEKQNIWYPTEQSMKGHQISDLNVPVGLKTKEEYEQVKDFLRPVMVSLVNCKKVLLDGPTFQNSPAWCLHPLMCEEVTLRNLTVRNPWYAQNGDGLDLESCKNTIIYKCNFDAGDDGICIKSGKGKDGRDRAIPTENLVVKDCIVYHGHGGFVVGSEMSSGVKNVHVSNCTFMGTDVGLRFKSTRGRGGVVENIYISDINMINIPAEAILFDLYYHGNSPIPEPEKGPGVDVAKLASLVVPVTEETPSFKDIYIKNVVCKGAGRAVFLQGLPEMNLKNVNIEDISITANKGLECIDADGVRLENINIKVAKGPVMSFKNSKNVQVGKFASAEAKNSPVILVEGSSSKNIRFEKTSLSDPKQEIVFSQGAADEAVLVE